MYGRYAYYHCKRFDHEWEPVYGKSGILHEYKCSVCGARQVKI